MNSPCLLFLAFSVLCPLGHADSDESSQIQYNLGVGGRVSYYLSHNGNSLPGSGSDEQRRKWIDIYEDLVHGIVDSEKMGDEERVDLAKRISQMTDTNGRPASDALALAETIKDYLDKNKSKKADEIKNELDRMDKEARKLRQAGDTDGSLNRFINAYGEKAKQRKISFDPKTHEAYLELATETGAWRYYAPLKRNSGYNGHYLWHKDTNGKWEPQARAWNDRTRAFEPLLPNHKITAKLPAAAAGSKGQAPIVAAGAGGAKSPNPGLKPAAAAENLVIVNKMGDTKTPYYVEKGQYYWEGKTLRDSAGKEVGYKVLDSGIHSYDKDDKGDYKKGEDGGVFFFYGDQKPDSRGTAQRRDSWALYRAENKGEGIQRNLRILNYDQMAWDEKRAKEKKAIVSIPRKALTPTQKIHVSGKPSATIVRLDLSKYMEKEPLKYGGKRKVFEIQEGPSEAARYADLEARSFRKVDGKLERTGSAADDAPQSGAGAQPAPLLPQGEGD